MLADGASLVSADEAGGIAVWKPLGEQRSVGLACCGDLGDERDTAFDAVPVGSAGARLCADPRDAGAFFAVAVDGSLLRLAVDDTSPPELRKDRLLNAYSRILPKPITAFCWDKEDGSAAALCLGLADGRVMRWDPSTPWEPPRRLGRENIHHGAVRHLTLAAGTGQTPGPRVLISAAADGQVGVWDVNTGEAFWGLRGLDGKHLVALGDHTRLVASGLVVNPVNNDRLDLGQHWSEKPPLAKEAPPCEAVLCLDLLRPSSPAAAPEESYWPSPAEQRAAQRKDAREIFEH